MKVLLVLAHPQASSLCAHLARSAETLLRGAGHDVDVLDLYEEHFSPLLTRQERQSYSGEGNVDPELAAFQSRLAAAQALVLVFPTWWFSLPAILKGWFDRVWFPGLAFEPGTPIRPLLTNLQHCIAITTQGSPWWVDWIVMWRPVARTLRRGILLACAPQARFRMLSLHGAESITPRKLQKFEGRMREALQQLK